MKLRDGTPKEAGISNSGSERIVRRAEGWVADGVHPALVVLAARKGVVFVHEAFGRLTPDVDSPVLPRDALFPLASLTKPITATAAMILVEDGLLGLNRRVQEYIPEFVGENKNQVMVHHLLTHTAGLVDENALILAVEKKEAALVEIPPPEETAHPTIHKWLHYGLDIPLPIEPGMEMLYSSYGFYLLGEIIRRLAGLSLGRFASDRLFDPLGMKDTYYSVLEAKWDRIVARPEDAAYAEDINSTDAYEMPSPSGGAFSTAMDMAIFGQMLLNQGVYDRTRILSPVTVLAMTRNQLPGIRARHHDETYPEAGWGLGWSINLAYKGHNYGEAMLSRSTFMHGGAGGVLLWIDPSLEIVGVYFSVAVGLSDTGSQDWNPDLFMNMVAAAVEDS